jgi:hypothetical protein
MATDRNSRSNSTDRPSATKAVVARAKAASTRSFTADGAITRAARTAAPKNSSASAKAIAPQT